MPDSDGEVEKSTAAVCTLMHTQPYYSGSSPEMVIAFFATPVALSAALSDFTVATPKRASCPLKLEV